jgi:hypothetical protein
MAAGGFKEFIAGSVLEEDDINDFLMQGVLVFAGTAARGSAITAPVEGQFAFLKDTDALTFYDGTEWVDFETGPGLMQWLVVAGGGGGARTNLGDNSLSGGGGAGGYRSGIAGELSGGTASAELSFAYTTGTYSVTVGAGGSGGASLNTSGSQGVSSVFASITSLGGGGGGARVGGGSGGSGGGAAATDGGAGNTGGAGTAKQGFAGGSSTGGANSAAGGGGAGGVGQTVGASASGSGGVGVSSSITGSAVTRATGGTGNADVAGSANTGNGAGGGNNATRNGGSGVVIFTVPKNSNVTFSAGVTQTSSTVGNQDVYVVTATSTTSETVTFA